MAQTLAEKIRSLREKAGMNQKQLAEASGLTQATISRIENGRVKQLKSEALKKLSGALRVTTDYLIDRTSRQTADDVYESDPEARVVFRGYEKLSKGGRAKLKTFIEFLEREERSKKGRG